MKKGIFRKGRRRWTISYASCSETDEELKREAGWAEIDRAMNLLADAMMYREAAELVRLEREIAGKRAWIREYDVDWDREFANAVKYLEMVEASL